MPKTVGVDVEVDTKGNIQMDFDGYKGNACIEEREKILKQLSRLGVNMTSQVVDMKPESKVTDTPMRPRQVKTR